MNLAEIAQTADDIIEWADHLRSGLESSEVGANYLDQYASDIHVELESLLHQFTCLETGTDRRRYEKLCGETPDLSGAVGAFAAALKAAFECRPTLTLREEAGWSPEACWAAFDALRDAAENLRLISQGHRIFDLGPPGCGPVIHGQAVNQLTNNRYRIIQALQDAGLAGLSLDELAKASDAERPDRSLAALIRDHPAWAMVVLMPGPGGQWSGYRLAPVCSYKTSENSH